eukprot:2222474-Rhodomonas_salina.1
MCLRRERSHGSDVVRRTWTSSAQTRGVWALLSRGFLCRYPGSSYLARLPYKKDTSIRESLLILEILLASVVLTVVNWVLGDGWNTLRCSSGPGGVGVIRRKQRKGMSLGRIRPTAATSCGGDTQVPGYPTPCVGIRTGREC